MEINCKDISFIAKTFNAIVEREEMLEYEWGMDENNTGISYDRPSHEDICKEVLRKFINQKKNNHECD